MGSKALIIGIAKYASPKNNLDGVENDVSSIVSVLAKFNITDLEILRDSNATGNAIKNGMHNLVSDAKEGDVRILYYSGHGVKLPENIGAVVPGKGSDEALVPYEGSLSSLVLDSWISNFLTISLNPGVSFWAIYDSCYSGSMFKDFALDQTEKFVLFKDLILDSAPSTLAINQKPVLSTKAAVIDLTLVNSFHLGAVQDTTTALVQTIDGIKRSVFTWAIEKSIHPDMTIEDFEKIVSEAQKSLTPDRVPQIAFGPGNEKRKMFSGIY